MHKKILPFAALAITLFTQSTGGDDHYQIVGVEETWSFTIGEPDASKTSPQVSTMMGPFNSTQSSHFVFTLNHANSPSFSAGGMQIQLWNGDSLESYVSGPKTGVLSHTGETVRWTQRLSVNNGTATFEVKSGSSTTWGSFGGQGYLKSSVGGVNNLNAYRPYLSLTESGVGYGGNRVSSLQLEKIVWELSTGQSYQLVAPIDIDADLDP